MFIKFSRRNKRGQNTAEYALLISLVVAAVIAMQTYAQRALQARIRDASNYMARQTSQLGSTTLQYEPYYLSSQYEVTRDGVDEYKSIGGKPEEGATDSRSGSSNMTRDKDGYQQMTYNLDDTSSW